MFPNRLSEAVYRILIRAYPKRFRLRHEQEMVEWFREHLENTRRLGGTVAWFRFWSLIITDLIQSLPAQHFRGEAVEKSPRTGSDRRAGKGGDSLMETLFDDARLAVRSFARAPALFALTIATLAIGVGFTTTIFSVIEGVLLASLPYPEAEQIVKVGKVSEGNDRIYAMSAPDVFDLRDRNGSFEALAVSVNTGMTLRGGGEPQILSAAIVSNGFFDVLGVQPSQGRAFTALEDEPGADPVVILGHGIWQRRWGGNRAILGQTVTLGKTAYTVVGIMPPGFLPPEALDQRDCEIWTTFSRINAELLNNRRDGWLQGIGRMRAGVSQDAARAELLGLGARLSEEFPEAGERLFGLEPLHQATVGNIGDKLLPLFGAVGLLLFIACFNVANLLLVRAVGRGREMALRSAIGAGQGRILRQLLTESLILGLLGGGLGVAIAVVGVRTVVAINPGDIPRLTEISINGNVLAFGILISLLTSLIFGLIPALRSSQPNLADGLREGVRNTGSSGRQQRLRSVLVISETAIAFVMVVGAGLLINSFLRLQHVDTGFDARNVNVLGISYPGESPEEILSFYQDFLGRISALPGVTHAGVTTNLPLSGRYAMQSIKEVEGRSLGADRKSAYYQHVSAEYFRAMGISLRKGREFDRTDRLDTPRVAVVNEAFASDLFGEQEPLGKRFKASDGHEDTWFEVIGVVADVRTLDMSQPGLPEMFLAFEQAPGGRTDIVVRTADGKVGLLPTLRALLHSRHPELPVRRLVLMEDFIADSIASPRFYTLVLGCFAGVALLLALVGIYGTLAYAVSQQSHDFGVRMALGASNSSLFLMVLGRGLKLVATGVALGVGGAMLATRALESLVFGVTPTDGLTMALGVATLLVTALLACLFPARRATQLDPILVLRND